MYVNLPTIPQSTTRFITLLRGDQFFRDADKIPFAQHWVVYTGPIGPSGEDIIHADEYGTRWDFFYRVFPEGQRFHIRRTARTPFEQDLVVQRAMGKLGAPYDIRKSNCEQLANYAAFGVPSSQQLVNAGLVGLGLAIWFLGRSDN